jgi:hypothetical protein
MGTHFWTSVAKIFIWQGFWAILVHLYGGSPAEGELERITQSLVATGLVTPPPRREMYSQSRK